MIESAQTPAPRPRRHIEIVVRRAADIEPGDVIERHDGSWQLVEAVGEKIERRDIEMLRGRDRVHRLGMAALRLRLEHADNAGKFWSEIVGLPEYQLINCQVAVEDSVPERGGRPEWLGAPSV